MIPTLTTLFVGNICYTTTERVLWDHFSRVGKVTDVRIITEKKRVGITWDSYIQIRSKGYGFVDMTEGAERAIAELSEVELDGRRLLVTMSKRGKDASE